MTWIEYAVIAEAQKARTTEGYSEPGVIALFQWANEIEEREKNGIKRQRLRPTREKTEIAPAEVLRRKQKRAEASRVRAAIKSAREIGAHQSAKELQEFYDTHYR